LLYLPPIVAYITSSNIKHFKRFTTWFPHQPLQNAFIPSLGTSFYIGALLSIIAVISALRGEKYIPEREILLF
jgi:ABC-type spermidine/putrescine transport system permease subunit II